MNDAFDRLEEQLREGVTRRAAAPTPQRRRRRRGGGRGLWIGVLGAVSLAGAAAGARAVLDIGEPIREVDAGRQVPDRGPGVIQDPSVRILSVRAADPQGGPPWALRVFNTNRGGGCVQVGQVYAGRFGLVRRDDDGKGPLKFRELEKLPGTNSLCSGRSVAGLPVVKGLRRLEITGGQGDPRRCDGGTCPVTAVTIVRYGMLGPAAREAFYVDRDGTRRARQSLTPRDGGAYLFAVAQDPKPFERASRDAESRNDAYEDALRRARRRGLSGGAAVRAAVRSLRRLPRPAAPSRPTEHVVARFANGKTIRVAGRGRERVPLPGVGRRRAPGPNAARARVTVSPAQVATTAAVTVSFSSSVTIRRFDEGFRVRRTRMKDGARCEIRVRGGFDARNEDVDRGATVRYRLRAPGRRGWTPGTWCVSVTLKRSGRETPVGTATFTVDR